MERHECAGGPGYVYANGNVRVGGNRGYANPADWWNARHKMKLFSYDGDWKVNPEWVMEDTEDGYRAVCEALTDISIRQEAAWLTYCEEKWSTTVLEHIEPCATMECLNSMRILPSKRMFEEHEAPVRLQPHSKRKRYEDDEDFSLEPISEAEEQPVTLEQPEQPVTPEQPEQPEQPATPEEQPATPEEQPVTSKPQQPTEEGVRDIAHRSHIQQVQIDSTVPEFEPYIARRSAAGTCDDPIIIQ